ncbi:hypothetical protein Glove_140g20 [Diversispora epigaea]|uniref:Uncharacterized protein n=1 Tax=Diversispora epigaea TaxID=1348612 RepID=A0A397J3N4_9GLOM|nr:hypothetical protein Glove_140g20 [Diversispora epigaea]
MTSLTTNNISWSDALETRLLELYRKDDIVDIFWGRRVEEHRAGSKLWNIYVITRGLFHSCPKTETLADGQVIHFIAEEDEFSKFDDDSQLNLPRISRDLQEKFDEALDNELGTSFRELHYNLVGISTGYKRISGKLTNISAIVLYVNQKGILRRGCGGIFPDKIRGIPVDVVETCLGKPCMGFGWKDCQRYQDVINLGSSVGIGLTEKEKTVGTLGVVVREKKSPKRVGIVSCEHVFKFGEYSIKKGIVSQPSSEDLLDTLYRDLKIYSKNKDKNKDQIEELERKIECVKKRDPSLSIYNIGVYETGVRKNIFLEQYNKIFGIDAAFCVFNNKNRKLYSKEFPFPIFSNDIKQVEFSDEISLNGFYTYDELNSFDDSNRVFKVGRTTGLTFGKLLPGYFSIAVQLRTQRIEYAKKTGKIIPPYNEESQGIFIGYMKSHLDSEILRRRRECYPIIWFDRQLAFRFKSSEFGSGDSGASIIDENGKALGILHSKFENNLFSFCIASPYFAVFDALNVEIFLSPNPIESTIISTKADSSENLE